MKDQLECKWVEKQQDTASSSAISAWLREGEKDGQFLIADIAKHGCVGGVPGVIYYKETVAFYNKHDEEILNMLISEAEQQGTTTGQLLDSIFKNLDAQPSSPTSWKNSLAWFAIELAAHHQMTSITEGAA